MATVTWNSVRSKSKAVDSLLLAKFQTPCSGSKLLRNVLIVLNYRAIRAAKPDFIEFAKEWRRKRAIYFFVNSARHQSRIDPCSLIMHNWYYSLSYVDIRESLLPRRYTNRFNVSQGHSCLLISFVLHGSFVAFLTQCY